MDLHLKAKKGTLSSQVGWKPLNNDNGDSPMGHNPCPNMPQLFHDKWMVTIKVDIGSTPFPSSENMFTAWSSTYGWWSTEHVQHMLEQTSQPMYQWLAVNTHQVVGSFTNQPPTSQSSAFFRMSRRACNFWHRSFEGRLWWTWWFSSGLDDVGPLTKRLAM